MKTTTKKVIMTTMMLLMAVMLWAQGNPVHFTVSQKQVSDTEIDVIFKGKIAAGWHVYAPNIPADGPIPATITTEKSEGVKAMGKLKAQGKEIKEYDQIFGMQLRYFENNVTFVQRYKITGKTYNVKGYLEYGACNDTGCMPPTSVEFAYKGNGPADAPEATEETANEAAADTAAAVAQVPADTAAVDTAAIGGDSNLWKPVIDKLQAYQEGGTTSHSLWYILMMGFVGGLLAVLMPCIWPIIPMTVSFFLKRNKDKAKGIRDAVTYGVSIIGGTVKRRYIFLGFDFLCQNSAICRLRLNDFCLFLFCMRKKHLYAFLYLNFCRIFLCHFCLLHYAFLFCFLYFNCTYLIFRYSCIFVKRCIRQPACISIREVEWHPALTR